MLEWCIMIATILLAVVVYFAYFFKFNWVKVSVDQVILSDLSSMFLYIAKIITKILRL